MLRYNIVSGILLVLSIIDFALAAPVLVQEKRQACVDMHISKEVTTMLGKRGLEDIEKLVEDLFDTGINPIELSDAHAPSSPAPLGPEHESTSVVQVPGPNPASTTSDPGLLSSPPVQGLWGNSLPEGQWWDEGDGELHEPTYYSPASSLHDSDHELTGVHDQQPNSISGPLADSYFDVNHWFAPAWPTEFGEAQAEHVQQSSPGPSTDSDFDWIHWTNLVNTPPSRPPSPKAIDQAQDYQAEHVQQPNSESSIGSSFFNYLFPPAPKPASPAELGRASENQVGHVQQPNPPSTDSDFNWKYWQELVNLSPPRPALSNEIGLASENQVGHVQQPNLGPSADPDFDWKYWQDLVNRPQENQAEQVQQPTPVPSTGSDFDWDHWTKLVNADLLPSKPVPPKDSGSVVHPSSLGAGSPTDPENNVVAPPSPDAGSLTEPDVEVVPGPPPSPIRHQLSSESGFQPNELQDAVNRIIKGKAKESRSVSGTAGRCQG